MKPRYRDLPPWTPFQPGVFKEMSEEHMVDAARVSGQSLEEVRAIAASIRETQRVFVNSRYQVNVRAASEQGYIWLSIKRLDKGPVGKERFRDFQRIKNEIIGPEHEAVELYPAESRLVDTANQYHLWVVADPTWKFPFGFGDRLIIEESSGGSRQEPFDKEDKHDRV